jgi:DNA-binding NarL/FixJ family response regulator
MMLDRLTAVAFDLGHDSLIALRQALPEWQIRALDGATSASLKRDWNPASADLLVVSAGRQAETLGLCRAFRSQAGRAHTPLLVLVPPAQEAFVRALLAAGATSCLILPVNAKDLVSMLTRAQAGNRPGHHTVSLDHAQRQDAWRDEGGEG